MVIILLREQRKQFFVEESAKDVISDIFSRSVQGMINAVYVTKGDSIRIRKAIKLYENNFNPVKLSEMEKHVQSLEDFNAKNNNELSKFHAKIDIDKAVEYKYQDKTAIGVVFGHDNQNGVKLRKYDIITSPEFKKHLGYYNAIILLEDGFMYPGLNEWAKNIINKYGKKKGGGKLVKRAKT